MPRPLPSVLRSAKMDTQGAAHSTYPFCPFFDPDSHFVAQHVQYCHPENESPTVSQPENQASALSGRRNGGSSSILNSREHVENAVYLDRSADSRNVFPSQTRPQDGGDMSIRSRSPLHDGRSENSIQTNSKKAPNRSIKRLGRSELGPYAHEKKMPSWLLQMLHKGNATTKINKITPDGKLSKHVVVDNEASDVIPALAQLCKQDKSVQRTFLCSPHVHHIFKMPREGSFCGYRNIQMLVSYMQESRCPGSEHFPGALPSILQLQDRIERAWDMGFNSIGRAETGGIKGTRKYIGTSEAQALFLSLDIQCEAISIAKTRDMPAHSSLLSHIAAYFRSACALDDETEKVVLTNLPPIYFQHHGHSMTIVGFEIRDQGRANVLVFDPSFKTPPLIMNSPTTKIKSSEPARILKGFRKGVSYLQKYELFELLKLPPPGIPLEV